MLMPVITVDMLGIDADGQGTLLSIGGIGALMITLWFGSRNSNRGKSLVIIGGAISYGISLVAFALTAKFTGNYRLALILMFMMGVTNSAYMIAVTSSLQVMVPDNMRGRVMGLFGMTWSFMPLGGMQAGAIANVIGTAFALAIGGCMVIGFALGPALFNRHVRRPGSLIEQKSQSTT